MSKGRSIRATRTGRAGKRGAVMVEYAMLLTLVAVPTIAGLSAAGVQMLKDYQTTREELLRARP